MHEVVQELGVQSISSPLQWPKTAKPQNLLFCCFDGVGSGIMVSVNCGLGLPSLGVAKVLY